MEHQNSELQSIPWPAIASLEMQKLGRIPVSKHDKTIKDDAIPGGIRFPEPYVDRTGPTIIIPAHRSAPAVKLPGNALTVVIVLADVFGVAGRLSLECVNTYLTGLHQMISHNTELVVYRTLIEKLIHSKNVLCSLRDRDLKADTNYRAAFQSRLPDAVCDLGLRVRQLAHNRPEAVGYLRAVEWLEQGMDVIDQLREFIKGKNRMGKQHGLPQSDDAEL